MTSLAQDKRLSPESNARYLLCSDLDRTLIPNGPQPESAEARPRLRRLLQRAAFCVVYVTGRNRSLVEDAIRRYQLPWPDAVIGDVGSRIWSTMQGSWENWDQWEALLLKDWDAGLRNRIVRRLEREPELAMQPASRQSDLKLSFFCPAKDTEKRCRHLRLRLQAEGIAVNLIGSVDETRNLGLIDVLPRRATKHSAIEMLMSAWGFQHWNTVCAGDSGNDLAFLTSALQSVLVANAEDSVRRRASRLARRRGQQDNLFIAQGGLLGMNGCYSAGVLEGLAHYLPETAAWMR